VLERLRSEVVSACEPIRFCLKLDKCTYLDLTSGMAQRDVPLGNLLRLHDTLARDFGCFRCWSLQLCSKVSPRNQSIIHGIFEASSLLFSFPSPKILHRRSEQHKSSFNPPKSIATIFLFHLGVNHCSTCMISALDICRKLSPDPFNSALSSFLFFVCLQTVFISGLYPGSALLTLHPIGLDGQVSGLLLLCLV
jgi:hypothetical protein